MANNPQVYGIIDPEASGGGPGVTPPLADVLAAGNTTNAIPIMGEPDGGSVAVRGGDGTTAGVWGGNAELRAGSVIAGSAARGGSAYCVAGNGATVGGSCYCLGGDSFDAGSNGGEGHFRAGNGPTGGNWFAGGGAGSGGAGGSCSLNAGQGTTAGGQVSIVGGSGDSLWGGNVVITPGWTNTGAPGDLVVSRAPNAASEESFLMVGGWGSNIPFAMIEGLYVCGADNVTYGSAFTPDTDMFVTHMDTYVFGSPSGTIQLAIYDDVWNLLATTTAVAAATGRVIAPLDSALKLRAGQIYQLGLFASAGSTSQFGYGREQQFVGGNPNISWFEGPGLWSGGGTPGTAAATAAFFMGVGSFGGL